MADTLFGKIQLFFHKRALAAALAAHTAKRQLTNWEDSRNVGIVYDCTNNTNDHTIFRFAEMLRGQGRTVEILGYSSDKKLEAKTDITLFTAKQVNWCNVPQSEALHSFTNKKFDLLLAAFIPPHPALEYVVATSQAKYRVGAFAEGKTDAYELMINMGGKTDLDYLLKQAQHFLGLIRYE